MNQTRPSLNAFDPRATGALHGGLADWFGQLAARTVVEAAGLRDWREMSKFGEIPNLAGVSLHPIALPIPAEWTPALSVATERGVPLDAAWDHAYEFALDRAMRSTCLVHVAGALGGEGETPINIECWLPGPRADLAEALRRMLWPQTSAPQCSLFWWAAPLIGRRDKVLAPALHWDSGTGFGMATGVDDPAWMAGRLADMGLHGRPGGAKIHSGPPSLFRLPLESAETLTAQGIAWNESIAPDTLIWGDAVDRDGRFHRPAPGDVRLLLKR